MKSAALERPVFTLSRPAVRIFNIGIGFNPVNHSAEAVKKALDDLKPLQGSALLIGGMAVIEHGYVRYTDDIDLLYENRDGKILERLKKHFKIVLNASNGWHELRHKKTNIRVELLPEGGLGMNGFLPFCDQIRGEGGYISLAGLIWLKLIASRPKDEVDIIEIYKCAKSRTGVIAARSVIPEELRARFDALIARAEIDLSNDQQLHPEKYMKRKLPSGEIIDLSDDAVSEAPARYPRKTKKRRAVRA